MSLFVPPRAAPVAAPVRAKAGPIGPGAGVLQTEFPLSLILGRGTPGDRMKRWLTIAKEAGWPDAAENAISTTILRQPWSIVDTDDTVVDDDYPNPLARQAYDLMDRPMAQLAAGEGTKYTRSELWRMTLRHAGICGSSFWFLNALNTYRWPTSVKYIAPWRMTPREDANGNLVSWWLDKTPTAQGIELSLEEVIHFFIYPPDTGHFGRSQLEIALLKAQNDAGFDKHVMQVLSAGGRLSGLLSPKQGDTISNDQYLQLVADARSVVEQPDAAKRLQIMRGPVEFQQTTMTIQDLQVVEMLKLYRDDTLSLWGVPPGYIVAQAVGLNSGEARKFDKQVLWENANHARVEMLTETLQLQLIDRWDAVGLNLSLEIEEPVFDDDSGRFDLVAKSLNTPLRNSERRALVNYEPFGPDVINPASGMPIDDEIWLPMTQQLVFSAGEDKGFVPEPPKPTVVVQPPTPPAQIPATTRAASAAGETSGTTVSTQAKAAIDLAATASLRRQLDTQYTGRVRDSVGRVLVEQRDDMIARVRARIDHLLATKGRDTDGLWDDAKWNARMNDALAPDLTSIARSVDGHIRASLKRPQTKAGPTGAVANTLARGGTRITGLNSRTRDAVLSAVRHTVAAGIAGGKSPAEVGDDLEEAIGSGVLDNGVPLWDEYRAEMVARSEMTAAYNSAALGSYTDFGVEQVQAIDGTGDEECAERNGNIYGIDEANSIEDHPNGTLDWLPILPNEGTE